MAPTRETSPELEFKTLAKLFFLFGFGIMSWIPRFPDFKARLGLTNGQFGSIISLGNVGAFISLLTVGHIVHKLGSYKVLIASTCSLYFGFALIANISSSLIFIPVVILVGFSSSAFHISVNSQAFDSQSRITKPIIVKLHGIWTIGAVSTGLLSGLLISRITASTQLDLIYVLVFLLKIRYINKIRPVSLKPQVEDDHYSVKRVFTSLRFDRLIAGGMICTIFVEIAMGDWSNIFGREYLGVKGGLITLPYILFMSAMIIGRLSISRILKVLPINRAANIGAVTGGTFFLIGVTSSILFGDSQKHLAFGLFAFGCFVAGLGTSFVTPSFFNAASARSPFPSSVVIGQIGLINNFLIFGGKWVVAWTAQFTSLAVALFIPGIMALSVPLFTKALLSGNAKGEAVEN
jgi:MFS family permease